MDITKLNLNELKVLAYDEMVKFEQSQNNLKIINEEIIKRNSESDVTKSSDKK